MCALPAYRDALGLLQALERDIGLRNSTKSRPLLPLHKGQAAKLLVSCYNRSHSSCLTDTTFSRRESVHRTRQTNANLFKYYTQPQPARTLAPPSYYAAVRGSLHRAVEDHIASVEYYLLKKQRSFRVILSSVNPNFICYHRLRNSCMR